jgi:hypothetical protein
MDMTEQAMTRAGQDALDPDTRWQVSEVLSRFAHMVDNGEWALLPLLFTPDATLSAQDGTANGLSEIESYLRPGDRWQAHHTLNTITRFRPDRTVSAWSRFLIVEAAGTTISGDYADVLTGTAEGWRIRSRRISLRNRPGTAPDGQPWRTESFATWIAG